MRIVYVEERRRGFMGKLAFGVLLAFQFGCLMAALGVQSPAHALAHKALTSQPAPTDYGLLLWAWAIGSLALAALAFLTRGRVQRFRTVAP